MQACQRRTIGGGGGGGGGGGDGDRGWLAQLRLHPPPLVSPFLLFAALSDHPTHPLRMGLIPFSVRRDCTAWGRYWGAYGSARGGAPLTPCLLLSLPVLPIPLPPFSLSIYLSFYLFLLPFANLPFYRSYARIPSVSAFPVPLILPLNRPPSPAADPSFRLRRDERRALYGRG